MLTLEIDFSGQRGGAILALAVDQGYLVGPETLTPIRARKGSDIAMQGVDPPDACRRVSLEIDFSGLSGGAILASAVDQGCLCGPVPQSDLKHFYLESSLGSAWLPGQLMQPGLDAFPEPESHGQPD